MARGTGGVDRRSVLVLGASLAAGGVAAGIGGLPGGAAPAAASTPGPKLPGEIGRSPGLRTRFAGTVFDRLQVRLPGGDTARLVVPQGLRPGDDAVVLWLYHSANGSDAAIGGEFAAIAEHAVDLGLIAICQRLGGTLFTNPTATAHQADGTAWLSSVYRVRRSFLRGAGHGGAMAAEVLATRAVPGVVGAYLVNPVYDLESDYLRGHPEASARVAAAFGGDAALIRARNPARHPSSAWAGTRMRATFAQPDGSDPVTPPAVHAKALLARAAPTATEASRHSHAAGHASPDFADAENQALLVRWMRETGGPARIPVPSPVASWDFAEAAPPFAAAVAGAPALEQGAGSGAVRVATPFGGGVQLDGRDDFLVVPAAKTGRLNVAKTTGRVTVAAWVLSTDHDVAMIAGCWQESRSDPRRSYALFNDMPMYGADDMVIMEVSRLGDVTPGYPFAVDFSAEPRKITRGVWQFYTGTYDGEVTWAYLDGVATPHTWTDAEGVTISRNPYVYPDGLNATPVDFMVGAVVRDAELINRHAGAIARLRVWDEALTPAQVKALYDAEKWAVR